MLTMMLGPQYKGLGLAIQNVGMEKAFKTTSEYDKATLFSLLVCAYKFLNPTNVSEKVPNFSELFGKFSIYKFL
jgi:hypothetical protein